MKAETKHHSRITWPQRSPVSIFEIILTFIHHYLFLLDWLRSTIFGCLLPLVQVMLSCHMFYLINLWTLASTVQMYLFLCNMVFFCLEQCNLFAGNAVFLSETFSVFLNTVQVGFVWCTLNTFQGNEETLKGQNSLPLSYLLHVTLYTMSNHAINMRVCVWYVYIHQTQIYSQNESWIKQIYTEYLFNTFLTTTYSHKS